MRERFPDIPRRVSGYNLDQLLPENGFNVARALVGTEGTCVTILEAECELKTESAVSAAGGAGVCGCVCGGGPCAGGAGVWPIGLEGFDGVLVDFMLRKNLVVEDVKLLPAGRGFLLCEFGADSAEDVDGMVERFVAGRRDLRGRPVVARYNEAEAARVWKVRESALGATVFVPGEASGWEGWEDSAVPPEKLGAYLRELFGLMAVYGYKSADVWALWAGVRASADQLRLQDGGGGGEVSAVYRGGGGYCAEVRGLVLGRAWGWAVAGGTAAEDVWAGADGSVSRVQGAVGSAEPG